ncbi:FIP1[V]-like protein [Telopea speciosissima]|uniref:FIP1[V]-like protein n=1 Tax=Telopea speciosissima TaxID=54955 RepID=UPI001CC65483|nr:FIP1[V]-like protein [Telopea speciosissima]
MEDDDEFGDLYTDVLRPFSSSKPTPSPVFSVVSGSSANPSSDPNIHSDDEEILYGAPNPSTSAHTQTLTFSAKKEKRSCTTAERDDANSNWNDSNRGNELEEKEEGKNKEPSRIFDDGISKSPKVHVSRYLENGAMESQQTEDLRVSETSEAFEKSGIDNAQGEEGSEIDRGLMKDDGVVQEEKAVGKGGIDVGVDGMDPKPTIPGLSGGSFIPGVYDNSGNGVSAKAAARMEDSGGIGDDWDSDSEDDLQIVLNDNTGPLAMDRKDGMGSEDEDGDGEDLVIVADGDQHHQPMEEQEWGDDSAQAPDGERKEGGDTVKLNGGMVNALGAKIGYNNNGYHPHHSQFKYIRSGAAVMPEGSAAGPGGVSGQVHPPVNMGPIAVRGRGDWRPSGFKAAPTMQKIFHSGFGPAWANNSVGRSYGGGLEFTLPSHKTVFGIDIDSFEEKPWRHPGVDAADFFNFGLDEEKWKGYSRQLEQLRLEATMQSKIRVYESGRSEQDYDPDLPPELTVIHDASAENALPGKIEGGQSDLIGQGKGAAHVRPPIPTGRAIQVEGGYGERLPSIDTRPPRIRDSDAVIEIVLQDSNDDDLITDNGTLERLENDSQGQHHNGGTHEVEDMGQTDRDYSDDRFPQTSNGYKSEIVGRRTPFMGPVHNNIHEGDGILPLPQEASIQNHSDSKGQSHIYPGKMHGTPHEERWPPDAAHYRYHPGTAEHGHDLVLSPSEQVSRFHDSQKEKSGAIIDHKQIPLSSSTTEMAAKEPNVGHKDGVHDDLVMGNGSTEVKGEDMVANSVISSDTAEDGDLVISVKKQNLSSRVEQTVVQDIGDADDLRATRSSDNSKASSGSSRVYQKQRESGEEEVVQEGRSRHMGDMKRHRDDEEHSFRRRDNYSRDGRHEKDQNCMAAKGREDPYNSYARRDWDLRSAHYSHIKSEGVEKPKERDNSAVAWQRRDEETHGRWGKDEETRRHERVEEIGSKHRSKVRESERNDKDEHLHSRKRLDNGDWKGHLDKDVGPRHRERDDNLISWPENMDVPHSKRRKDEEHQRREQAEKEEALHGYRAREETRQRKRESDDVLDQRRRDDQIRGRDRSDDHRASRHKDESWRQRERDDRQRLKQSHEDSVTKRDSEEARGSSRSRRGLEEKLWTVNLGAKDECKGLGSDKDRQLKDKRRDSEQTKKRDRMEDETPLQHMGREVVHGCDNQSNKEERSSRHARSSSHNDHPVNASDRHWMHKERYKENMRKRKESEVGDQNTLGPVKRKQENSTTHWNEKVTMKGSEQERGNVLTLGPSESNDPAKSRSSNVFSKKTRHEDEIPQQRHSSRKHREDAPSDDEQQTSRKCRSKLEHWPSQKERDHNTSSQTALLKSIEANMNGPSSFASEQPDESSKTAKTVNNQYSLGDERNTGGLEDKDSEISLTPGNQPEAEKIGGDCHLDTVAKLKKRSEQFNLPMPSEKDGISNKMESEQLSATQTKTAENTEVRPERPARKRRWISN